MKPNYSSSHVYAKNIECTRVFMYINPICPMIQLQTQKYPKIIKRRKRVA